MPTCSNFDNLLLTSILSPITTQLRERPIDVIVKNWEISIIPGTAKRATEDLYK
jgi:hypothetical protein